jgi:sacsin
MKTTLGYRAPTCCIIYDSDWAVASCISNQPFLDVKFYGEAILTYKLELKLLGVLIGFENSEKNYKLIIDNFEFSSSSITSDATALILKCIRYARPCDVFLSKLRVLKWLKTNVGFCAPSESFLLDPEWECLLMVFDGIPVVDSRFYGGKISPYKEELKKTGLITKFDEASKAMADIFKQMVLKSSLTKTSVQDLLKCYRQLRTHDPIPVEIFCCMRSENWLCTSLGFSSPSEAILFDEDWQSLSPIAKLPFINDGDSLHGLSKEIHGYKDELKDLGVTTGGKAHGARFVIAGLDIPEDPADISAATVLSLLGSVRSCIGEIPKDFMEKITSCRWLRTTLGYRSPKECILFEPKQPSIHIKDGPFIDESFYGSEIASFKDALAAIGVTVDVRSGGDLVAQYLRNHKETATITRIYMYLKECNWSPADKESDWIWKPNELEGGEWVSPLSSVLRDPSNLFSPQLNVLDRYYDKELLVFFSSVFGVRHGPGAEDHSKLWRTWEISGSEISVADCSAFWQFIARNWSKNTEKLLSDFVKVPVCADGKITLSQKKDVFIPDDLLLKDLFEKLPQQSIFIWYPSSSLSVSRARLNSIYGSIGVQAISKAAKTNDSFTLEGGNCQTVDQCKVISVGLLRTVLGFLADPALDISCKERHTMVSCLLNVSVLETKKPITVRYCVQLSSAKSVDVKANRMIRWERENSTLYVQQRNGAAGYKEKIEYATNFADEISQGLLFEMPDSIPSLAELIKLGSLVDFQDAALEYLLKSKNLQLFPEDEAFLNATSLGLSPTN